MKRPATAIASILMVLLAVAVAQADEANCVAIAGGNLLIPDGTSCVLRHTIITGNVVVGRDAGLRVGDEVTILGNLLIDRCDYVSFEPSADSHIRVAGNVEIRHCAETSGKPFTAGQLTIGGNFCAATMQRPALRWR